MQRILTLHEGNVVFESLTLDAEGLKNTEHLSEAIIGLAHLSSLDTLISSDLLRLIDAIHFFNLCCLCLFHHGLSHHKLLKNLLLAVLTPAEPCLPKITVLKGKEEFFSSVDGPIVKVLFTSSRTDPLEDFTAESLASYGTDNITGILFFANKRDPLEEDVFLLVDVDIAFLAVLEGCKRLLKVLLDLITFLCGSIQALG